MPSLTLPASFHFPNMTTELAEADGMYDGRDRHYLSVGLSALRAIEDALGEAPPRRILDLPCGHGRVTRVLRARFPEAAITVCDLDRDGVDFTAARFGARGVYSVEDFRALHLGERYDLIWVGSLITHLPEPQTRRFLDCMARHMAPRSTLVVTSHGPPVAARLRSWGYGLPPEAVSGLLEDHARTGYGYRDYPGGRGYGVSLVDRQWMVEAVSQGPLRLDRYSEAAWDDHQDVLVLRLREGRPGSSALRFFAGAVSRRERRAAARRDEVNTAPQLGLAECQGQSRPAGRVAGEAVRKAIRAVTALRADGYGHTGAPAVSTQGCGKMEEQPTRTRDKASDDGAEAFDEAWYLASYPDVAEAVSRGDFASARAHYLGYGRKEGRLPGAAAAQQGAASPEARGAEGAAAPDID